MKIYTYKCPNCSASVDVSSKVKQVKCEYCGQTFWIDKKDIELKNNVEVNKIKDKRLVVAMICSCILAAVFLYTTKLLPFALFTIASLVFGIIVFKRKHYTGLIGIIVGGIMMVLLIWVIHYIISNSGTSPNLSFEIQTLQNPDLFNNLTEEDIITILEQIPEINEVAAVNSLNDTNDGLKKEDGYTAAIYFSLKEIEPDKLGYEEVIKGGNRLGGCIELYRNEKDVQKRLKHLDKGRYLGSGGHGSVENMLIRTSDVLTPAKQQELADLIVKYIDSYYSEETER